MGFTPKRKIFVLDFADTALDGLTVKTRSAPLGVFMRIGELADIFETAVTAKETTQALGDMLGIFESVLIEWDLLDDKGGDVPPTAEGMKTLDPPEAMLLITAWQDAVGGVPAPLAQPSSGGTPSPALSLPMEPLSADLAS